MTTLLSRLFADPRRARRLRQARAEIRRTVRVTAERQRLRDPGYDELMDPKFITVMLLSVIVLVLDVRGLVDWSALIGWFHAIVALLRGMA